VPVDRERRAPDRHMSGRSNTPALPAGTQPRHAPAAFWGRFVMKRFWLTLLAIAGPVLVQAAPNVATTSEKGSVLVFPLVVSYTGATQTTTYIRLANDGSGSIDMHCEYRDNNPAFHGGFVIPLKTRQAVWFDVSAGGTIDTKPVPAFPSGGDGVGLLVCWAVDPGDSMQIRWNHVDGLANVVNFSNGSAIEYKAWAFQVRAAVGDKQPVGTPGVIKLNGDEYDACPRFLHGVDDNNLVGGANARAVVTPCVFDVRQDYDPFAKQLTIESWNTAGTSLGSSAQAADHWQDLNLPPGGEASFEIRATGGACLNPDLPQTCGIVGIIYRPLSNPASGTGLSASGSRDGLILWDPDGGAP
jgi:hypothetical protein